jgi:catechol-2,3-dioxygenase
MLGDNRAVATIPVRDGARAKEFYQEKLGLQPMEIRDGVTTYSSGGTAIFVYESEAAGTNKATSATWAVPDVDAVVADLKKRGVAFERYDNLPGMAMKGDIHIGAGDMKVAWFKDPDGNILSIVSSH